MDLDFDTEAEAFRAELRQFLASSLPKDWQGIAKAGDDAWKFSVEFCRQLGERGWLTQAWPHEYGGLDADVWRQIVLQEELWAHNEPRGPQYMNVNWIGPALMAFGTEAQKANFLPRIAAGTILWGQLFSEPDSGSDLASLQCRAVPVEGGFSVTGTKIWTSYGDIAEYGFLLARSEAGSRRKMGLSVLLVDLGLPGIERRPIRSILGHHRINEFFFTDAFVPDSALLGPMHDGWRVAMSALAFERSGSARYARSARVLGFVESDRESWEADDAERLVRQMAFGRATELINYHVAALKERGASLREYPSIARLHNCTLEQELADLIEELAPARALIGGDDPTETERGEAEAMWRNAGAATVTSGSYEIQMGIVAQAMLGLELSR